MHFQQLQVGLQFREFFHGPDVLFVRLETSTVFRIQSFQILTTIGLIQQIAMRIPGGVLGINRVLDVEWQERAEIQIGGLQRIQHFRLFCLQRSNSLFKVGSPWDFQRLIHNSQRGLINGFSDGPQTTQHIQPQHVAKGLAVMWRGDVFVGDGIDVASAPLHKKRHCPMAQVFFDHSGRKARKVCRT